MSYAPFPLVWGFFGSGGGGGGPAFGVIQTDFGTYPTASGTSDVLTLVSADSARYYFTGTALTDTVTLTVTGLIPPGGSYGQILAKASGTNFDTEWRDGVQVTSVYNNSGATITKGSVVYINGASGNLPTIALSQANAESTSSKTYGLVVADISNMSSGAVVASGQIRNLNTFGVTEGVTLWLSPTTAGGYTTTKPTAPNHAVAVGVCTRAHPTLGTIEVKIQNGYELEELHNVSISSPSNGQILSYDSATSLWKNTTISGTGTVTSVSVVTANGLAGTVATATTTPAITLSTTVTGLLKGNGTAISAATAGTDYQTPITTGNLTESTSSILTITGGSNAIIGSGTTIQVKQASGTQSGYLTSTDWTTFNSKEPALTKGNLTESTSSVLTITGGSNAIIGSGTTIQVKQASGTQSGYLTSTDWTTFNSKEPALTKGNLTEATSSVLTITGGSNAIIGSGTSIQVKQSSGTQSGYLSSTDWSTFNGKPNLTSTAALSITTSNAVGTATDAARSDHTHRGVASFAKNGSTALYGDVTLSAGTNITLTQVGNDIAIASTASGGTGTVTNVSVVSANGLAGTVANPTTTPAITLSTSITGLLKGNGTAISAAVSGTDYEPPVTKGNLSASYPLSVSGGTNAVIGSGASVNISPADGLTDGYLRSTDWSTFYNKQTQVIGAASTVTSVNLTASRAVISNGSGKIDVSATTSTELGYVSGVTSAIQTQLNGKEPTLTKGNLTESTSSVLTITGGSNAVIGSGTTIQVKAVSTSQSGYFSSDDYKTFKTNGNIKDTDYSVLTKWGVTSLTTVNGQTANVSGTQTSVARLFTTGLIGKTPHVLSQSVSSAGANCGYRMGSTTNLPFIAGGFKFSHFFQIADDAPVALARNFVGFNNINLAMAINTTTNTDPFRSTFTNFFGVGYDGFFGDTNLKLFYNAGVAGSTTVVDLGSGFSITAGADFYQVIFYNIPDSFDVYYEVIGWTSGNKASGVITTNLPTGVDLYAHTMRSNGGTAAVVKIRQAAMHLYIGS